MAVQYPEKLLSKMLPPPRGVVFAGCDGTKYRRGLTEALRCLVNSPHREDFKTRKAQLEAAFIESLKRDIASVVIYP